VAASGVRISWMQIPARVRAAIEAIIGGGAVVTAVSQSGGFSPGTADRVVTADGRRAFVKAVSSTQNEQSPSLHRAEAHVVGQLPSTSFVPGLLGVYDDGAWVGLVFEDLDGHTPAVPWNAAELEAAMTALQHMAQEFNAEPGTPPGVERAPTPLSSPVGTDPCRSRLVRPAPAVCECRSLRRL
jgi:hypothetical protein